MIDTKKLTTLRTYSESLWNLAVDTATDRSVAAGDRAEATASWEAAMESVAEGDLESAIANLEDARSLAKAWGADRYEREAIVEVRASEMVGEVAALVGADAGGDLGVIVRQALADDPKATAQDIADIVREARADALAE